MPNILPLTHHTTFLVFPTYLLTYENKWDMPDELRFYLPPKLEHKMLKSFDFGHIEVFKQYFSMLDVSVVCCVLCVVCCVLYAVCCVLCVVCCVLCAVCCVLCAVCCVLCCVIVLS